MNDQLIDGKVLEFLIFCIENVATKLKVSGDEAYHLLAYQTDILDKYIVENHQILHTQSKEYIVEDLISYINEYGGVR